MGNFRVGNVWSHLFEKVLYMAEFYRIFILSEVDYKSDNLRKPMHLQNQ